MALTDNKAKIQALIAGINALPEAGSGTPSAPALQEKSATPSTSAQVITPDSEYDGLSKVTLNAIPGEYIVPTGTKNISENGLYDVSAFADVNVSVEGATAGIDLVNAHDVFTGTFTFAENTLCNTHRITVQLSDEVQANKRGMYALIYDTTMDANPTSNQSHSAFNSAKTNQFISAAACAFNGNGMSVEEGGHFYKSGTSAMSTNSNFYIIANTTAPSVYVGSSDSTRFYGAGRTYAYLFFTLEAENY